MLLSELKENINRCTSDAYYLLCFECPYADKGCTRAMLKDALKAINAVQKKAKK